MKLEASGKYVNHQRSSISYLTKWKKKRTQEANEETQAERQFQYEVVSNDTAFKEELLSVSNCILPF